MIELSDIEKSFGQLKVLDRVSLRVDKGEMVSIVGPSGAGKTTLLQVMGTLERPERGIVSYDGTDVYALKSAPLARFRNARIGFVFQFHQLLPEFTLEENVALPAMLGGASRRQAMARAAELLDYMGLTQRADHKPANVSGGERQRAAVARALVNSPDVILADEPTGSLDSHNRAELHRLFFNLRRDLGQTFVIVTHDENLAADTDRVIHMLDGRIENISSR